MDQPRAIPRQRQTLWVRLRAFRMLVVGYLLLVLTGCLSISAPVDYLMNLGTAPLWEELKVAPEAGRQVVVLKHGLWRSAGSLWKLERALEAHGYEVLNESYPTTVGYMQDHADRLSDELEAFADQQGAERPDFHFVGHSMGGLVMRSYLSRPQHVQPKTAVYIAVPHRGAALLDKRRELFFFKLFMGNEAALQLSPKDDFYTTLKDDRSKMDVGVVYGMTGTVEGRNDDVPGDDDGTVGVEEVQLPGAKAIGLEVGHTRITYADGTIHAVLYFLKHRRFPAKD